MNAKIGFIAMLLVGACASDDPDLRGVTFKCDGDHPCPSGTCTAGLCSPMSGPGGDGVKCGTVSCGAGQQCCAGPLISPVCQALGASCTSPGAAIATCDGVEDCGEDRACCGSDSTACGPASCSPRACQTGDDCTGGLSCCFQFPYLTWGTCSVC